MLITLGSFVLAIRSARVQTAAVALATDQLSKALGVEARVERVEVRLPLSMYLQNVYMSDQSGDTLLAVPSIRVRFNPFALEQQKLHFPLVQISQPTIHLLQDSTSTNLDFLVRAFQSQQPKKKIPFEIDCSKIIVENATIHYLNTAHDIDILLSNVGTDVGLSYRNDTVSTILRNLHVKAQVVPYQLCVETNLHGSLDTLFADQLHVMYRGKQILDGNLSVQNVLHKDAMSAQINCTDLFANAQIIKSIISDWTHQPAVLPTLVENMGDFHYRGSMSGSLKDIRVRGALTTPYGSLSVRGRASNMRSVHATVDVNTFDLGTWLHYPDLGRLSASCELDAYLQGLATTADASIRISKLDYKGYRYSHILLKGEYANQTSAAELYIDDPHASLSLKAQVTNMLASPEANIHVHIPNLELSALHLSKQEMNHQVSLSSSAHLKLDTTMENWTDGLMGHIQFDSVLIQGGGHQLPIQQMNIELGTDSGIHFMHLESPVLTANVDGYFQWLTLPATIQRMLHRSLPSLVDMPSDHGGCNDLEFHAEVIQADDLIPVLVNTPWHFPSTPTLNGYVSESDSTFSVSLFTPEITNGNTAYQKMAITLDNNNPHYNTTFRLSIMQHIISKDSTRLRVGDLMADLKMIAHHDTLTSSLEFGPVANVDSLPDLLVVTTFAQQHHAPSIHAHVMPTSFFLGEKEWIVNESHIRYAAFNHVLSIEKFMLSTNNQQLMVDGKMSRSYTDSLRIEFNNVDLGYLLSSTKILDAINFSGHMTGWGTLYGAFATPQFEANVTMPHGIINGTDLGTVSAQAVMDRRKGEVQITGTAVRNNILIADVKGRVVTSKPPYWEIFIDANGTPLDFLNFWTKGILNNVKGEAFGQIHIFGRNRRTWVTTRAFAKDAAVTIPATGCRYVFSDSIVMDTTCIKLPSIHIQDIEGHKGLLSGRIDHTNFTKFNFHINAQFTDMLAIDLPSSSQNTYFGRAYATGKVEIIGNEWQTLIDVNATTANNTDFYLSLATASSASASEFITFRSPTTEANDTTQKNPVAKRASHLLLNLSIEALPNARVHLVLDEHNGDGIVGRGEGNIRLNMDASEGSLQMLGTYTLLNGTFSYTVGNLVHRDFSIAEGSTVSWSGDATNPKLDITAKYRCTASLRDLFGADVKSVTSRSSIPVDCVVRITGTMKDMILHFGIEYPQSDESVAAQINAIINTEAMLMRQVVYLLVFNRFYTPDYMRTTNRSAGLNDAYSLLSSTVTGQINSWLSKLTSMVNVGFNMRADGEAGNQSYETEANVQIQPVDRLTINGNVGYRYNDITNQPFFGDADVEYELTADGKLRAKVFTHSVDKYSLHQSGMQEGVGFVFRHDFNPGDAKKRRELKKTKTQK